MTKSKKAEKPSSSYNIGDRTVAQTYWDGNDYVTKYNPTDGETAAMDTLQAGIPQAYKDAVDAEGLASYKQNWINNQTDQLNELANTQLTNLKDKLITGGQVGSSTGWNKIKAFTDSYTDSLNDIVANADTNALNYQNNLLNYANNLQGAMNNYYDLSTSLAQTSANNQSSAANQNLAYHQANNSSNNGLFSALSSIGSLAGGIGTLAGGWGSAAGSLAKNTGGSK